MGKYALKWSVLAAALVAGLAIPEVSAAQTVLKIFDAHLHYNQEPNPLFSLEKVQETFRRNRVAGIIANSRPNKGTHQLAEVKSADLWVVPFIRPYRTRDDVWNWSTDPAIYDLIENEYKRGYYVGVGEFHIQGKAAEAPLVKKTVDFAVARDLYILAHCDEQALLILFAHNPKAKIIWAHTGFSTPVTRVRELLDTYPALTAELSYRGGITEQGGVLANEWRETFAKYPTRFLIGSDTWIPERWISYDSIMATYRGWLGQLPPDQARLIAHGNAERLFNGKMPMN
ncbi:MAG TPA: amidohydrolase family protein [Xanthobacteraceae bacterium]|nr:amidohydrolase family protein [Xanthobacteraceae bacterium]